MLQIGCDPKSDSTFTLTGFLIPTIIDTLRAKTVVMKMFGMKMLFTKVIRCRLCRAGGPPADWLWWICCGKLKTFKRIQCFL